ncbi:hypothetical protein ANCCAN_21240 [Ancylostoma caninum]|uniref:Uncharacterized protein n=1 Tax=Ancylostoma caninum TaxID=29170 RepID=A0A368FQ54_ANCCA|nr:hypothetical protein ANCCAN_21240 [Ancylostoma caninum]
MSDEAGDMKLTAPAEEALPTDWLVDFMAQVAENGKSSIPWTEVQPALLKYFETAMHEKIRVHEKDEDSKEKSEAVDIEHCYQMVYNKVKDFVDFPDAKLRKQRVKKSKRAASNTGTVGRGRGRKRKESDPVAKSNASTKGRGRGRKRKESDPAAKSDSSTVGRGRGRKRKENGPTEKSTPENQDQVDTKPAEAVMSDVTNCK